MGLSHHDAFVLLGLLVAVAALLAAAPLLRIPYPILLVLGGLAIGFVPGMPDLVLPPELVLVVVLPPLLYAAAFFTSLREVRSNVKQITLLATGLVLATTLIVGVVAHTLVGLPWAAAFVLGAIVSPTDPLAATSIARRVGVPRQDRLHRRGREPDQRRDGARCLSRRGDRGRDRRLLALGRRAAVRRERSGRHRSRPGRRLCRPLRAPSARRSAGRDHDRAA